MNKLYLALVCLMVTAFAVSTSVDANYRRGRRCENGSCSRKEKTCKTGSCKREKSCAVCPACPVKTYREPKETFCVVEKYCKEVPDVKIVPTTKFIEVECVSNVVKECCVKEGKPCSPETAAGMTRIENAPAHIQRAMETPAVK